MKYLTSLSLTNIKDKSDQEPTYESDGVNPDSKEIKSEHKHWGSGLEEVWAASTKADVNLEEITVDVVVPAFIAYPQSLRKLDIRATEEGLWCIDFSVPQLGIISSQVDLDPVVASPSSLTGLDVIVSCYYLRLQLVSTK